MSRSLKTLALGSLMLAGATAGGLSQASSNVYWSVDFAVPGVPVAVGGTVSNAPRGVYPAPAVIAPRVVVPPPVVYRPYPVVYGPSPVVYGPSPVVVLPQPVMYGPPAYVVHRKGWKANRWHARDHGYHAHYGQYGHPGPYRPYGN